MHFPFSAQQTGPEYFKTAHKCGIFGVCNDGESRQVIYLIDEAENPGKGADCVTSLLHHYFEHHGAGEKSMYLHADNCVEQNKINATVQYLMWRLMTGRHEFIELSFMLVGHTKFSPDRFFGLFKKHSSGLRCVQYLTLLRQFLYQHKMNRIYHSLSGISMVYAKFSFISGVPI